MKKKYLFILTSCILALSLGACGKKNAEQPQEAPAEASVEESVETEPVTETPATESLNQYVATIGELSDAWSGDLGVGLSTVNSLTTFSQVNMSPPNGYNLAYFKMGDKVLSTVDDLASVPTEGTFVVAYLPENVTNMSDERLIEMRFSVPYDMNINPRHYNYDNVTLGDFKLNEVSFNVHKSDGTESGNGLTVPGYTSTVLTKDEFVNAFGSENVISDASSVVELAKPGTVFTQTIMGNFLDSGLLTKVSFTYDINYGVDLSLLGGSSLGQFTDFVNELPVNTYYAVYRSKNEPQYLFVAAPDTVDVGGQGYSASVYGIRGGEVYDFTNGGYVNSSSEDGCPIKMSDIGNIMCAGANQVVSIGVDVNDGVVNVVSSGVYTADENGNPLYQIQVGDADPITETTSTNFDAMMMDYNNATALIFVPKM